MKTTAMVIQNDANNSGNARRRKKKRSAIATLQKFEDLYEATGETLGQGSFGAVSTYRNLLTGREFAVKKIMKTEARNRHKVLKEIEIFHHCKGQENIIQLIEYFEEEDCFHMIFEKMEGGSLLETIWRRGHLTEQEASLVIRDIARALNFLHSKGIAHRDLKPENILCAKQGQLVPVKICDFDLGSGIARNSRDNSPLLTPELLTPVGSAEYMAPEVVDVWVDQGWSYDKRCDLWSLGIITYMMLCGYPPFYGQCPSQDCGWERGDSCNACQDSLFERIQYGEFEFPAREWSRVSVAARDLISHLLVKDPHSRYTAPEVLKHPWVSMESPQAQLATPQVLHRNNSVKELEAFAESANAVNRLLVRHMSMAEAYDTAAVLRHAAARCSQEPPFPGVSEEDELQFGGQEPVFKLPHDMADPMFEAGEESDCGGDDGVEGGMFFIGDLSDEEEDKPHSGGIGAGETPAARIWGIMRLTPPGSSSLAQRRSQRRLQTNNLLRDSCGDGGAESSLASSLESSEGDPSPMLGMSPHKATSALF